MFLSVVKLSSWKLNYKKPGQVLFLLTITIAGAPICIIEPMKQTIGSSASNKHAPGVNLVERTGRRPQFRLLAKYIHKTVRTDTDWARYDWLLLMIRYWWVKKKTFNFIANDAGNVGFIGVRSNIPFFREIFVVNMCWHIFHKWD